MQRRYYFGLKQKRAILPNRAAVPGRAEDSLGGRRSGTGAKMETGRGLDRGIGRALSEGRREGDKASSTREGGAVCYIGVLHGERGELTIQSDLLKADFTFITKKGGGGKWEFYS